MCIKHARILNKYFDRLKTFDDYFDNTGEETTSSFLFCIYTEK